MEPTTEFHGTTAQRKFWSKAGYYLLGILSLAWLAIRSGSKPSRLAYPCQRSAAAFGLNFLGSLTPLLGAAILAGRTNYEQTRWTMERRRVFMVGVIGGCAVLIIAAGIIFRNTLLPAFIRPVISDTRTVELPSEPNPNPRVAIIHREVAPDENEIAVMVNQAIEGALGSGGLANLVANGDTVLIKPNLGCGYETHETTDWQVVKPIVQAAKTAGASQVLIAEGEGCSYGPAIFDLSGYSANITDVVYVDFNDTATYPTYDVSVNGGYWDEAVAIPQVYFDADVVISVPTLKTHNEAGVTIGLKNAFGVPPVSLYSGGAAYRVLLHTNYGIRKSIPQINLARQPDLAVVDALVAGEGQGPWYADPVVMNTILAGSDLVALDAVGTTLMGIDPERIPYLTYAHYKNLGVMDLEAIQIIGTPVADLRRQFALPAEAAMIYRKAVVVEKTSQPLLIDGLANDWYGVIPVRLVDEISVISGSLHYEGAYDLGIEGRFLYDQDAFYALIQVQDDEKIANPNPAARPAQGDTIEIYLSGTNPWERLEEPAYGSADFHLGVAYGINPTVWDIGRGTDIPSAQVALVDNEDGYTIELRLPFSALDSYMPGENQQIGLDLTGIDLDSGQTGETIMAWSGNIELPNDARRMGVALLGAERAGQTELTTSIFLPLISSD